MEAMESRNHHHLFFFHKDLNRWNYPEPILVLLLFFPSKREVEAMTDLEKLGIWAAKKAREEIKKIRNDGTNDSESHTQQEGQA
jgi:hypothetical protein